MNPTINRNRLIKYLVPVGLCLMQITAPVMASIVKEVNKPNHYKQDFADLKHFKAWLDRPSTVEFTPNSTSEDDYHLMKGHSTITGSIEIFKKQKSIFEFTARQKGKTNKILGGGECHIELMESERNCDGWDESGGDSKAYDDKIFFSESKTFFVGVVPVSVKAEASGGWGFTITGEEVRNITTIDVEPGVGVEAVTSAVIGIESILAAGVEGQFTIVDLTIGNSLDMRYYTSDDSAAEGGQSRPKLEWTRNRYHTFTLLAGRLRPFTQALGKAKKYADPIVEWDGITKTVPDGDSEGVFLD